MVDYTTSRARHGRAGGGVALFVVAAIAATIVGLAVLDGRTDWPDAPPTAETAGNGAIAGSD